ncbi:TetR/AcrR family transcriptional regulator [Leucobacter luti]|nr:TetR/AcrR family transcriptional regulator [Leucobacter luti]
MHRAILELAAEKPLAEITVSEFTDRAGINRVTFYKHYAAPADALAAALEPELEVIRERFVADPDSLTAEPLEVFQHGVNDILDHVEAHRPIYLGSPASGGDGGPADVLSRLTVGTFKHYLERRALWEPALPDIDHDVVSAFYGHGLAAAILHWLQSGDPDREAFLRSMIVLVPDWWFPAAHTPQEGVDAVLAASA